MRSGVYVWRNKLNGKSYVGYSHDVEKRVKEHLSLAKKGKGWAFHSALRKHGPDAFECHLIYESESVDRLKAAERLLIHMLDTLDNGYNCTPGGDGVIAPGAMLGPQSEEHRNKIGSSLKGITRGAQTDEHKRSIAISRDSTVYNMIHESGELFTGFLYDFRTKYEVPAYATQRLVSGRHKTSHGWSIV